MRLIVPVRVEYFHGAEIDVEDDASLASIREMAEMVAHEDLERMLRRANRTTSSMTLTAYPKDAVAKRSRRRR